MSKVGDVLFEIRLGLEQNGTLLFQIGVRIPKCRSFFLQAFCRLARIVQFGRQVVGLLHALGNRRPHLHLYLLKLPCFSLGDG